MGRLSVVGVVIRAASVAWWEEQRKAGLSFVSWLDSHSSVGPDSLLPACFLLDKYQQLVRALTPLPSLLQSQSINSAAGENAEQGERGDRTVRSRSQGPWPLLQVWPICCHLEVIINANLFKVQYKTVWDRRVVEFAQVRISVCVEHMNIGTQIARFLCLRLDCWSFEYFLQADPARRYVCADQEKRDNQCKWFLYYVESKNVNITIVCVYIFLTICQSWLSFFAECWVNSMIKFQLRFSQLQMKITKTTMISEQPEPRLERFSHLRVGVGKWQQRWHPVSWSFDSPIADLMTFYFPGLRCLMMMESRERTEMTSPSGLSRLASQVWRLARSSRSAAGRREAGRARWSSAPSGGILEPRVSLPLQPGATPKLETIHLETAQGTATHPLEVVATLPQPTTLWVEVRAHNLWNFGCRAITINGIW